MRSGPIEIGRQAPDFALRDQHGQLVRLMSFRGEKSVVLMFYPFAFSGVCTGELGAVRDNLPQFESERVALLAISCDPVFALRTFAEADALTFPLLSDFWPHGEVASAYGVLDAARGCPNRSTFIVDRSGMVHWSVHHAVPEARDLTEQSRVLAAIEA
ncbi:MAG: peroxiredoxin [Nocardioides sp.]